MMLFIRLILAWLVLYGPIGFVMYLVTTFLFAFSGSQYRMTPVVNTGWQIVALVVLGMGCTALLISKSLKKALLTMFISAAIAWLVTFFVYRQLAEVVTYR